MNPDDFILNITPKITTVRLNQDFTTEITIEINKGVFVRHKSEKLSLILSVGKREYEFEFTKKRNFKLITHQSKIGLANGLQRRTISLKTTKGQTITKTEQLLNVDTSSALKKTFVSGVLIGVLIFLTFYMSILYLWFSIPISILAAFAITKSKLLAPDNSESALLDQYKEEEKLTEESAQRLYNSALGICDDIKQEKENIKELIEESQKAIHLQLKVIREQYTEQEGTLKDLQTKISEFKVRYKTMESNSAKIKEMETDLEKTLETLRNRFNKKLKGLTESFEKTLHEKVSGLVEGAKANQTALETLRTDVTNQQKNHRSLKDEIESLPTEFEQEITKLLVEFEHVKKELLETPTKKTTESLSKNDRELLKKLDSSGKILKSLETQLKDTNGKLQKIEGKFKKGLTDFEKYKNAKTPAEKIFNLESELRTYNKSFKDALTTLNEKVNTFSDLASQKLEAGAELTESEVALALADLKSQISTLQTNFSQLSNEFAEVKETPINAVPEQLVTPNDLADIEQDLRKAIGDLQQTLVDEINALEQKIDTIQPVEKTTTSQQKEVSRTESSNSDGFDIDKFLTDLEKSAENQEEI